MPQFKPESSRHRQDAYYGRSSGGTAVVEKKKDGVKHRSE
jgi:hypothetical protein